MTDETGTPTEQSNDSLPRDEYQSSEDGSFSQELAQLRAENTELKSRIGSLAQKSGQKEKELEAEWTQWASNYQAWAENELRKKDDTINRLEEKFLEVGDDAGARVVLDERRNREAEERRSREVAEEQTRLRRDEINTAIEQAVRSFDNVTEAEIRARTPREASQVWTIAASISREKDRPQPVAVGEPPIAQPQPLSERNDEVDEQERNSRTPGEPRGSNQPAASRRLDEDQTRLNELKEAYEEAKRKKRRDQAIALRGEIVAVERRIALNNTRR